MRANLRSGGQGQDHCERKCKNRLSRIISSSKVDRFTSNQDQNDRRIHIHFTDRTASFCDICLLSERAARRDRHLAT